MSNHLSLIVIKNKRKRIYDFVSSTSPLCGKMRTIGRIIRKHNLYARIRDPEHIDILGAETEQLPAIWHDLIEAGLTTNASLS